MNIRIWVSVCVAVAFILGGVQAPSTAGTTGGVTGRITDAASHAPLSDVTVTADSPSQAVTTTTDSNGIYRFLSLAPDTYTLNFSKTGYTPIAQPGLSIFADQVQTFNAALQPALKTIAAVRSRSASDVVKPGTTSDVYSVNASGLRASTGLVGPGGLSNAYGAIASVPGVNIDPGEQGWFQTVHIRGGDIDQIGYELDGIPVNRAYDNAPQTMLSSLGQQELQVYTGGTPATADAQGISGYINQVVKTGTYPGFANADFGIGAPAFYHKASFELGGADPKHLFSYYVGIAGADQAYRYVDNNNGGEAGNANWFFYPVNALPGANGFVWTGPLTPTSFTTGSAYGIASSAQRDSVVNLHYAIPHKNGLRDDFQFLWMTSEVPIQYYSSANDLGPGIVGASYSPCSGSFVVNGVCSQTWDDAFLYNGPMGAAFNPSLISTYLFPSSPQQRIAGLPLPFTQRDTNDNGIAVSKFQYQHSFSPSAFFRLYGYTLYSNWFIYGPNSAAQPLYGAELADYEIPNHTWGVNASFTDQISSQHLLTASAVYTATNLQRYSAGFFTGSGSRVMSLLTNGTSPNSSCFTPDPAPGMPTQQVGCYSLLANTGASAPLVGSGNCPEPDYGVAKGGTCTGLGVPAGLQWTAVDRGITANLNQVHPRFSGFSLTDEWRPSERWTINGGLRVENFRFLLGDTSPSDPARQFWFAHYNSEFCFVPGSATAPSLAPNNGLGPCASPAVSVSTNPLVNTSGGQIDTARWQPRLGLTYTVNPDTVLRASAGVYARPQNTSWVQYNTVQEDLPLFLGSHFYTYNFTTPEHDIRPDTSYNYDVSLEKRLHGTDWSFKVTPYLRSTRDQLQNFFIDPLTGLESGLNVGSQTSYGVEFALRKGDFSQQGWSGQLSYTYTHSRIKYQNFAGTNRNVIDNLNSSIQDYNAYTSACATAPSNNPNSPCFYPGFVPGTSPAKLATGVAPAQCYVAGAPGSCSAAGAIQNPYWNSTPQPLLDRNGEYTTYDVIPGPYSAQNGYEVPNIVSLMVNYRHDRLAITPTMNWTEGASYGAPLSWPGYRPETCTAALSGTNADPASCTDNGLLPVFLPDPYNGNKFDNLGAFRQPWRVSLNMNISYDFSSNISADVQLTNLVDYCGQRGYAWDNGNVCVYSNLPSGIFPPAGNFFPNSNSTIVPAQVRFPYSFWLNNNNTGFVGVQIPFQATFNLHFRM